MKRVCLLWILLALSGSGQERPRPSKLEIRDLVRLPPTYAGLLLGSPKCDADGNAYLVRYEPPLSNTVLRLGADGKTIVRFSLGGVADMEKSQLVDFAVGPQNQVFELTAHPGKEPGTTEAEIARFDNDGKARGTIRLDVTDVVPRQLAILPSGFLFVAGYRYKKSDTTTQRVGFVGIFNERGQLVSSVPLPETHAAADKRPSGPNLTESEELLDISVAQPGPDGNIYLARLTPRGPVFAVSPSGEPVAAHSLIPPQENMDLLDVKVSGGRLAAVYQGKEDQNGTAPVWIRVTDISTDEVIADYFHADYRIGVSLACYDPEIFTFVSSEEGRLQIVRAAPAR